jgi:hypothetical protein
MARQPNASKLDEIATPEVQKAWLVSPASEMVMPMRKFPELGDDRYDDRLADLLNAPEWPFIQTFLRRYISNFIFEPFATEGIWWNATIAERGGRVQINIWRQYALVIDFRAPEESAEPLATGWVWVDADQLEAALQSGFQLPHPFQIEEGLVGNSVRQKRIALSGASVGAVNNLFAEEWMLRAARSVNLDLMRAGVLAFGWPKFHAPKLVDAVFADEHGERPREIGSRETSAGDAPSAEETEIQRLIWLRKNQPKYSASVKRHWEGRCAVTGIESASVLEACHIKPFSEANDVERGDAFNGLCLAAHIHSAFDAHLIGFTPSGEICFSDRLSQEDRERMRLDDTIKIKATDKHLPYVADRYARFLAANPSLAAISNERRREEEKRRDGDRIEIVSPRQGG